jgi:dihydrolipoamide dehydrogenase
METQLVVLGGGPGGYAAAFMAADLGLQVTLVDAEPRLGGACLLRGCIPSKALLHVAKVIADARHATDWGVAFANPKIDLDAMRARKEKVIAALSGGLAQLAKRRNVQVIRARGVFEDSQTLRLEQAGDKPPAADRLRFQHCILATGSSPTRLPALALPTPRAMDSTAALDLPEVPESLLVVGGGYIGLEMGTVYAVLGSRVSVVEMTDGLLPGVDRDLVKPLHKRLEKDFAAIWLNAKVVAMADKKDSIEVTFEGSGVRDQGPEDRVQASGVGGQGPTTQHPTTDNRQLTTSTRRFGRVLVAVGRRPNSAGLGLEHTKVQVDSRGFVMVDPLRRTADPHILAIGDVASEPMLAHKAAHEGKIAAEVLAGHEAAVFSPRAIPAVVFTDPEIAWAGLTEGEAKKEGRAVEVAQFPWAASGRAQSVGRTEGLTKWIIDPESRCVLGCGIVGAGAGELIAEAVLAIEMGATVEDVAQSIHPHPTLSETLGFAAEVYLGTATDIYRPKSPRKA